MQKGYNRSKPRKLQQFTVAFSIHLSFDLLTASYLMRISGSFVIVV